jgi:hypothetical protein
MASSPTHADLEPIYEETWRDFNDDNSQIGDEYLKMKEEEEKRWCLYEKYIPSKKCLGIISVCLMMFISGCLLYMISFPTT